MLNLLKMLKLQNVYLKHGSMQNRLAYKKRRNYYCYFTKEEERRLF